MAVLQRNSMPSKAGITVSEALPLSGERRTSNRKERYYRPTIHRTLPITILILIALAFIGLIELSLRKLPQTDSSTKSPQGRLSRRDASPQYGDLILETDAVPNQQPAAQTKFLNPGIVSVAGGPGSVSSTSPVLSSVTLAASYSAFLKPGTTAISVGEPPPSSYLNAQVQTISATAKPPTSVLSSSTTSNSIISPSSTTSMAEITGGINIRTSLLVASTVGSTNFVNLAVPTISIPTSTNKPPGQTLVIVPPATTAPHSSSISSSRPVTSTTTATPAVPDQFASMLKSDVPLQFVQQPQNYFYAIYLPTLLAVIFKMLMSYLYATTKMMEPFSMLSQTHGVPAKDFLWINYLSGNDSLAPYFALVSGHWLMLWTSVTYLVVQALSALSTELFSIYPSYYFVNKATAVGGGAVWIHPNIARLLQGLLAFTCIMLISIRLLLFKNRSHIYSNPTSLASFASLLSYPPLVQEISDMLQCSKKKDILKRLSSVRFHLGPYQATDGTECYGIIPDSFSSYNSRHDQNYPDTAFAPASYPFPSPPTPSMSPSSRSQSRTPFSRLISNLPPTPTQFALNTLTLLILLGLFGLILAYNFTRLPNPFEVFMDAQTFGPRFILAIAGLILKTGWSRLERRSVVFSPFETAYSSSAGGVSASKILLPTRPLIPLQTLCTSLWRKDLFPALVALTALLSEILIILLPGIPFEDGQIYLASNLSRYISYGILGFMVLILGFMGARAVVRRKAGNVPRLPKEPSTIGGLMMYLVETRLAQETADLGFCSAAEIKARLSGENRGVRLAQAAGEQGEEETWKLELVEEIGDFW